MAHGKVGTWSWYAVRLVPLCPSDLPIRPLVCSFVFLSFFLTFFFVLLVSIRSSVQHLLVTSVTEFVLKGH